MKWFVVFFLSVVFLLILGAVWNQYDEQGRRENISFYTYQFGPTVETLNGVPFWLVALCIHFIVNGIFFIRWMVVEIRWKRGLVEVPLNPMKLMGLNLIVDPMLIFLHIVVRATNL